MTCTSNLRVSSADCDYSLAVAESTKKASHKVTQHRFMFRNLPPVRWFFAALMVVLVSTPGFAQPAPATALSLSQPLTIKWRYSSDQATNFTPATDGKSLYVPLSGGTMIALNATDGRLQWRAEAGGDFSATPCVDDQVVYVATQYPAAETNITRGALRAVSKETGITLWMRTLQAPVLGGLVVGQGALFAGSSNGNVYAFDKRTGRTIWVNQYGDGFESHPTLTGNRLYIGSNGGWLLALSQSSGEVIWSFRARGSIQGAIAVTNGTGLLRLRRWIRLRGQRSRSKASLEAPHRCCRSGSCLVRGRRDCVIIR